MKTSCLVFVLEFILLSASVSAQTQTSEPAGIVKVPAVSRSVQYVAYRMGISTRVDFKGTPLLPDAKGQGKIDSQPTITSVEVEFEKLEPAAKFGPAYLTYVLWAITPEGRAINLGEVTLNGRKGKAKLTTRLQAFAMIVTAEPYFAITVPSEIVVLENIPRQDTEGRVGTVTAKDELLLRGAYDGAKFEAFQIDPKVPVELYQARNAIRIAKWQGAEKYAPESLDKAEKTLQQAEDYLKRSQPRKSIAMVSREAVQLAEDARGITLKRVDEEQQAQQREAAAAKARAEAEAKAAAEAAEARRRADEEARRQAEMAAARESQLKAEAEAQAAKMKAEAEIQAAKAKADQDALLAREQAAKAEAERAEREKQELRARLLEQFNRILETTDTPRGLVVNMADVLFDTGKYDLRPAAREKLAKLSGIVLAHPGLRLDVEGHTDSTGSHEFNQKLSEQRAGAVRSYLVDQGLAAASITSQGFAETIPVADNDTAAGRQQNRRVEIIVSGEVIGTKIGPPAALQ